MRAKTLIKILIGLLLIGILRLTNATPTCPLQMVSSDIRIDDQEKLDQAINELSGGYNELKCVTLTILNRDNHPYKINLVELLKIKTSFVISGLGLQQVRLDCTGTSNDTDSPLSGLMYVGFYRLAFHDCTVPLWIENVATIKMEEVTFSGSKEGAVNIFNCQNVTIVNCSFENNNSTGQFARSRFQGSSGGLSIGIYRNTSTTIDNEDVSIVVDSCRFIDNKAYAFGSDVHTATSLLTRNIITGRGGGMSLTLDSNNTVRSDITHNHFEKNMARVYGGGLYFLVNNVTKNQTFLFKENTFIDNQALLTSGAMIFGLVGMVPTGSSINVNILKNHFEGNSAQLGGAFRFQRPTGNQGNYLMINDCTFKRNMAIENGAAIGISKAQFFNFDQLSIPITIANCTFSENWSIRGGTVFSAYTAIAFNGSNSFTNNQGVALNLLASVVKFYGYMEFTNNNVQMYDGGALYMASFSQMILYDGASLNFINNTGSFGSAIVVEVFSRLTRTIFGTTNLCFMQYQDSFASPYTWTNVSVNFTNNEAIVGSAVYTNSAQHCLSNSKADDVLFDWPFMHYSINNNTGQINGTDRKFYVQTPLTRFDITDNIVKTFPGENFPLTVKSFDLSNLPAAGILQLTLPNNFIGLDPSAVVLRPNHQSYGFTYDVTNSITYDVDIEVTVQAFKSTSQVESPSVTNIRVTALPCPPGNVLHDKCKCDMNDVYIVDCFENYTAVILHLGLWGYSTNGRLGYYQCPHGYCQCTEVNQNGNALCSSIYYYNESNRQCNCDREGILCGRCTDGAGVTALLNRCAHCSDTNAILIGAIILTSIVVSSILLLYRISMPEWLYPFLFYIQITGYVTDAYQTSFSYVQQTNLYISSALSLYFPYDFCLFSGMTPLLAYTLRYIPSLVSVLVFLSIFFLIKCCRSSNKCPRMRISFNGLWILVVLVYSHTVYTSLSILHCLQVGDSNGNKKIVWFVDGTVECFTGGHAALATFAIIISIISVILMIFTLFISLKRKWSFDLSDALAKPYKREYKWWSAVELFRRYLIILFIVAIPGNHAPTILLLIVYILLYGYVQPFKVKFVNALEFAFLVDILLLQMIKSTNDIQIADFLDVIEYQRDCGKAIKVKKFAFILMLLLLYIPVVVTLLLVAVSAGMKLKNGIVYLFNHTPVLTKRSRHDSFTWSYATTPTAAASSYLLLTDDGVHLASQADTYT